uniref:Uncharacterized protein n=1 Tax=Rangifer tarandus platyrhynchus TaxID=3082113 RepID=A0ACB0DX02_RANTA|nr:unnamed protein product [Rangifer tarandus platyrhynchus]
MRPLRSPGNSRHTVGGETEDPKCASAGSTGIRLTPPVATESSAPVQPAWPPSGSPGSALPPPAPVLSGPLPHTLEASRKPVLLGPDPPDRLYVWS